MLRSIFVCSLLASLQLICSAAPDSSFDNLFKVHSEDHNFAECQIFSKKYEKWWLHAEKYAASSKRRVTLGRFAVFSEKRQGLWKFIPAEGVINGYYLQNSLYGENLYTSSTLFGFNPFTQKRREIFTWRLSKDLQMDKNQFIWILTKDQNSPDSFYIYNLANREPLYAGSWSYKGGVYTWHEKHEDHDQFRWIFDCEGVQPAYKP